MTLSWEQIAIEAVDPSALGRWWLEALGWVLVDDDPEAFEIQPAAGQTPGLLFLQASGPKNKKNRLHLDFRPDDQEREVARLQALGARPADIGQGEVSWKVLLDPEGNEFCVLSAPTDASDPG